MVLLSPNFTLTTQQTYTTPYNNYVQVSLTKTNLIDGMVGKCNDSLLLLPNDDLSDDFDEKLLQINQNPWENYNFFQSDKILNPGNV